ncbi:MFS transporter [Mannheimia granulomatis]|uniref:MFS transporter n=1 Tax=Mannheimia granulomatis TaxID=85402 RepID=A0A011NB25_9PAST|nr:MFS transporter [Mannheimia granulomatis]EXI61565.1 MFS transporter [Mannheimia granulomatis]RGE48328.1 MFS transporter [Mannheimia granulomatis]
MDIRQKIAHNKMTSFQWLVVALTVILNMLDGFDLMALAFTAKSIREELQLDGAQIGTLMSAGLFGMAVGSLCLSPLADKFGRRPLLLIGTALATLGMLMTYFANSIFEIGLWRVVTGLGVASILTGTNVLVSEYSSNKWRGLAIAIYASGFGIGAMLGGLSAVLLQDIYGWRAVFLVGAILTGSVFLLLFFVLPESVEFLISKRPKNAQARLNQIAIKLGLGEGWELPEVEFKGKNKVAITRLFESEYRRNTLLIWLAFIAISASFYFISSWTPALLEEAGMAKTQSQTVGMAISVGGTIGSLIFGFLVSRFAAKHILQLFSLCSAATVVAFVFSSSLGLAIALAILVGGLINGCITGLYTINPTLYASDFRSTGVGTAIGVGRLGSIVSPTLAGVLLDSGWKKNELYLGAAIVLMLAACTVHFLKQKK